MMANSTTYMLNHTHTHTYSHTSSVHDVARELIFIYTTQNPNVQLAVVASYVNSFNYVIVWVCDTVVCFTFFFLFLLHFSPFNELYGGLTSTKFFRFFFCNQFILFASCLLMPLRHSNKSSYRYGMTLSLLPCTHYNLKFFNLTFCICNCNVANQIENLMWLANLLPFIPIFHSFQNVRKFEIRKWNSCALFACFFFSSVAVISFESFFVFFSFFNFRFGIKR